MRLKALILSALLLLGLILRLHNYDRYPQRGATSDEYTYSFLGVSLLTTHKPVSWSYFDVYLHPKGLKIEGIYFPIVQPYFDHPPFYGLLVGSWALINGQNMFDKIQLHTIRLVSVILSFVTGIFVFLVAKMLWDFETGITALLIFSTTTTFVLNGRVTVSENLVAFWFVLAVYLFLRWEKKLTPGRLGLLGMLGGLSFLTQVLSSSLFVAVLVCLLVKKVKIKSTLIFSLSFLAFVLLYILYGAYFGWDTFIAVNRLQGIRPIGPLTFWYIFSTPIIINKIYFDGWYLFGFLSLLLFTFDPKNLIIKLIPLFYILFLVLTLTERGQSGWYVIPLFPFMALASSKSLIDSIRGKSLFFVVFLLFAGLYELNVFKGVYGMTNDLFRSAIILLFVPALWVTLGSKSSPAGWGKNILSIYLWILLIGNAWITWKYVHPA